MMIIIAQSLSLVALLSIGATEGKKVYYEDRFGDATEFSLNWRNPSKDKPSPSLGKWQLLEGAGGGLKTVEDQRRYVITRKFKEPFSNEESNFVLQFTVRHTQVIDCASGHINLYDESIDQSRIEGLGVPLLSFGPSQCDGNQQILVNWRYKGKVYPIKNDLPTPYDTVTHLYTLLVRPDQTYEVSVDLQNIATGSLMQDWRMLPPQYIQDPNAKRPEGWITAAEIDDPNDREPEDWVEAEDGLWKPRKIINPHYEGPWIAPLIENPAYQMDEKLYVLKKVAAVGIDIWQSQSGSIFNNILITDDVGYAREEALKHWEPFYKKEKGAYDENARKMREKYEEMGRKIREESLARHQGSASKNSTSQAIPAEENQQPQITKQQPNVQVGEDAATEKESQTSQEL